MISNTGAYRVLQLYGIGNNAFGEDLRFMFFFVLIHLVTIYKKIMILEMNAYLIVELYYIINTVSGGGCFVWLFLVYG